MGEQTDLVKRKLLKAAVYAPPVILGSMVASPRTVMGIPPWLEPPTDPIGSTQTCTLFAGGTVTITISSGTNACCPCVPGSINFSTTVCNKKRCELSCGTNCAPGVLATVRCKNFCQTCGFTVAGCLTPCTCNATTGACP